MKKLFIISLLFIFSFALAAPQSDAASMADRLSGRILLQVEDRGEAWYIYPDDLQRYYLGYPADAFEIMRKLGLGATHEFITSHTIYPDHVLGKILIDVDDLGKAYYIYPVDRRAYYLGYPKDAFNIMRSLGLGITNSDLNQITISTESPAVVYNNTTLVTEVINNNTIKLDDGRIIYLFGIADGEDMEVFVEESTEKLRQIVLNKRITLGEAPSEDDPDTFLVYVDGYEVNLELVRQGFGLPTAEFDPDSADKYILALFDAIGGHRGLWNTPDYNIWIEEFNYDAEGNDNDNLNDEYVRIMADDLVNFTNWRVEDSDGNGFTFGMLFTMPNETTGFTLFSGDGFNFLLTQYWESDTEIWDNYGDTLYLYDHNGRLVLEYSY